MNAPKRGLRVRLAPLRPADDDEFLAAVAASRALHRPWISPPTTAQAYGLLAARMQGPSHFAWCVRRRDSGALAGYVEVTQIVRGPFRSAYIGWYAFAGHERQGLMTEAVRQVVRHAFGKLALHRLEANLQPENLASVGLARACGFRREGYSPRYLKIRGRWRDHERWAILAD